MDVTDQFLHSRGFQRERSGSAWSWMRIVPNATRQCVATADGYVHGEVLFSLLIEKPDHLREYISAGDSGETYLDMMHAQLSKAGLSRLGSTGLRGWRDAENRSAVEALEKFALPWFDAHVDTFELGKAIKAGESEGPPDGAGGLRALFGLRTSKNLKVELPPADLQRLANLYLEAGDFSAAHDCLAEYAARMKYSAESNPHRHVWLIALERLRSRAHP